MKPRSSSRRGGDTRAKDAAGVPPSDEIAPKMVRGWWIASLFPLGIGYLMYFVEASDFEKSRLVNPVSTVGEFARAECKTYRKAGAFVSPHYMRVTYGFKAPDGQTYDAAGALVERSAQPLRWFTATKDMSYRSWAECQAALPAVQAAKASHKLWYEPNNPNAGRSSLDAPNSAGILWLGLASIPLALYAWLLSVLRQRQLASNQVPEAAMALAHDRLRYPLQFVQFTQKPVFRKTFVCLVFLFLIGGFVAQFFWAIDKERAGKERLRQAAAQAGRQP